MSTLKQNYFNMKPQMSTIIYVYEWQCSETRQMYNNNADHVRTAVGYKG
jgi:hypothetical protein